MSIRFGNVPTSRFPESFLHWQHKLKYIGLEAVVRRINI